jgi:hypothetical protein
MTKGSPATSVQRLRGLWAALAILLSGCGEPVPSSPAATFALLYISGTPFCPLAGTFDVTFRIEPFAREAVIAVADDGMRLHVQWPPGFVGGTFDDPVVRDPAGQVVARDGERIVSPPQGLPNLHGYSVCFGGGSIYVMDHTVR